MSQPEINSIQDWESEELSEAELDALAGGTLGVVIPSRMLGSGSSPLVNTPTSSYSDLFTPFNTDFFIP